MTARVDAKRPCKSSFAARPRKNEQKVSSAMLRRDLAGVVAAHAVGDREQREFGVPHDAVLVDGARATQVGAHANAEHEGGHSTAAGSPVDRPPGVRCCVSLKSTTGYTEHTEPRMLFFSVISVSLGGSPSCTRVQKGIAKALLLCCNAQCRDSRDSQGRHSMKVKLVFCAAGSQSHGRCGSVVGAPLVRGGVRREQADHDHGNGHEMEWMNPHARFYVDVKEADGKVTNWNFELGALPVLLKQGWRKDSLKAGDQVTVEGSRAKDGSTTGNARSVKLPDGRRVFGRIVGRRRPRRIHDRRQHRRLERDDQDPHSCSSSRRRCSRSRSSLPHAESRRRSASRQAATPLDAAPGHRGRLARCRVCRMDIPISRASGMDLAEARGARTRPTCCRGPPRSSRIAGPIRARKISRRAVCRAARRARLRITRRSLRRPSWC